jgi:hypothetical protein
MPHADVEATLEWVSWFNQRKLIRPTGYPPADAEANCYRELANQNLLGGGLI